MTYTVTYYGLDMIVDMKRSNTIPPEIEVREHIHELNNTNHVLGCQYAIIADENGEYVKKVAG